MAMVAIGGPSRLSKNGNANALNQLGRLSDWWAVVGMRYKQYERMPK